MKKLLALLIFGNLIFSANAQSYDFTIENYKDSVAFLTNYYGNKQYYNDTAIVKNGKFSFEGDKEPGIYGVISPSQDVYFEFVINEPGFEVSATAPDVRGTAVFKNSKENVAFYKWMGTLQKSQKQNQALQQQLKEASTDQQKDEINKQIEELNTNTKDFQKNFISTNKNLLVSQIFAMSVEGDMPEGLSKEEKFEYYKEHYFDNINLNNDALLRTPVLAKKLDMYIKKMTIQQPDSICAAVNRITSLTSDTSLIFRYVIQSTLMDYEKSEYMGMDAVFICLAESYYVPGKDFWVDSTKHAEIIEQYETRKNLIVGAQAENIILQDSAKNWVNLYDVDANYTVVIFWEPSCGHCKKEMPKLKKMYEENKDKYGIEVFAVCTDFETEEWVKFIHENELTWINVTDYPEVNENAMPYLQSGKTTLNSLNFRTYWDIYSTPQVYVLDKDKKIIAKKLGAENIVDFINKYEANQAKMAK